MRVPCSSTAVPRSPMTPACSHRALQKLARCCTDHSCSCSQPACMSAVAGGAPWRTRAKSAKAVSALRAMRSVDGCQRTGLLFLSISLDILRPIGARRHAESLAEAAAEMRGAVETPGEGDLADRASAPARIGQLAGGFFQAPAQHIGRNALSLAGKDHAQVAGRDIQGARHGVRAKVRLA